MNMCLKLGRCILFSRKRQTRVQKELEDAAKEVGGLTGDGLSDLGGDLAMADVMVSSNVPTKAITKFVSSDLFPGNDNTNAKLA